MQFMQARIAKQPRQWTSALSLVLITSDKRSLQLMMSQTFSIMFLSCKTLVLKPNYPQVKQQVLIVLQLVYIV
jgi:hypothetical protein